ncbi:ABC transporter ATP-binding protein/permease [Amphibacillus sp. MSJ-3]|uniref:ABC transporter ATP-binding protein n=1 Tax=Amphibacillus sp. MSJ-3 TaxID=2841505 RepID=UPI001C0EE5BA|nr:ABC transporter ATP-binding protein [Amphibacillus sp. MSJ-3]MBU5594078.1 ABC transporter ATP-binding protein/permease [Amphibacillus sp. MSJ-3]
MSVFQDLKKYKGLVTLVFFLTLGNTIGELYLPRLLSLIVDNGIAVEDVQYVFRIGGLMLLVTLLTIIVRGSASYFSAKAAMAFSRDLRKRIFNKVNHMTFDETEALGISSLITRTTNDVGHIEQFVLLMMRPLLRAPLQFIGGLVMAYLTHRRLTAIVLISMPIIFVLIYFIIRVVIPYFPKLQNALDRVNLLLRQRLTGLKVIRAFSRDKEEEAIFEEANDDYYRLSMRINNAMSTVQPLLTFVVSVTTVIAVYFGSQFIADGTMNIGELLAFIQYTAQVMTGLVMLSRMLMIIPRTSTSISRVQEVIDYPSRKVGGTTRLTEPMQSIEAKDLTFYYPGANLPALDKINFSLKTGEVLGIIGGTGSGKSTFLKLLMQFYQPTEGDLLINGEPINQLYTDDVRRRISYVPQQNFFFSESIRGNMQYSNPDISDEQILNDLTIARAREFLPKEEALDTKVIRGGANFSGGQRQRLAITRALARDASVYIFDDSFSALDYRTDYQIRQALEDRLRGAMTIIVAQRVATIRHADKILVLENGKVQGYGSHDDLLAHHPVYREIAISQGEEVGR